MARFRFIDKLSKRMDNLSRYTFRHTMEVAMSDITYERTERDKKGNVIRIYFFIGGKLGYFFQNRKGEIEWFTIDFGVVEPLLERRARKLACREFSALPRRFFPQALAPAYKKNTVWVFVRCVLPDSADTDIGRWYGMNVRTGEQFMKPLKKGEHNPFSGKEMKAMWAEADRVLSKERERVLFGRKQLSLDL